MASAAATPPKLTEPRPRLNARSIEESVATLPASAVRTLRSGRPVEYYFSGLARAHRLESLDVILDAEVVRDDRRKRQPALQQARHLVPSLKHFASIDALDRQALEDDLIPVDGSVFRRDAKDR